MNIKHKDNVVDRLKEELSGEGLSQDQIEVVISSYREGIDLFSTPVQVRKVRRTVVT